MTDEYIKREDAQNVINTWIEQPDEILRAKFIYRDLSAIPAADVAPVVRGRDCRWRHDDSNPMWLPCVEVETDPDWFCADGERREVQDG